MPKQSARSYMTRKRRKPHASKRNVIIAMVVIVLAIILLLSRLPQSGEGSVSTTGKGMTQSMDVSMETMLD